jgi:hypothetical protein
MPFHCILHQQALWAEHKQGSNKREQQTTHHIFSGTPPWTIQDASEGSKLAVAMIRNA